MEPWNNRTSPIFVQTEQHFTPSPRSASKPFIYTSKSPQQHQPYQSPFQNGKPKLGYISPTFMSGDCFYPQLSTPKVSLTPKHKDSASPIVTPKHQLYEQYLLKQNGKHQKTVTQPVIKIPVPQDFENTHMIGSPQNRSPKTNKSVNLSQTPKSSKTENSTLSTMTSQKVCLNCFNHDIANVNKEKLQSEKINDIDLLQRNLQRELNKIQTEMEQEQKKKNEERRVLRTEYTEYQNRKEIYKNQLQKEKEIQRKLDQQITQQLEREAKENLQRQQKIKENFTQNINQQIQEKQRISSYYDKTTKPSQNSLDVGEEYRKFQAKEGVVLDVQDFLKQLRKQKLKQDHQIINQSIGEALQQKALLKQIQKQQEKDYAEFVKQQDEYQRKQQEMERIQEQQKKYQLNAGLEKQLNQKKQKMQQQLAEDLIQQQLRKTEPSETPKVPCDSCLKPVPKQLLSRVKKLK